tara:strand:- start:516 stop:755 length:240 start_codon:yes stop_codon:yes gene_type:complete
MKIGEKHQVIIIEALRQYRNMQVSMKIDASETAELLKDIRAEKERVEKIEQAAKKQPLDEQLNPMTGEVIDESFQDKTK